MYPRQNPSNVENLKLNTGIFKINNKNYNDLQLKHKLHTISDVLCSGKHTKQIIAWPFEWIINAPTRATPHSW